MAAAIVFAWRSKAGIAWETQEIVGIASPPWREEPDRPAVHGVTKSRTRLSDFTFTFHFHALEKEMATHSTVLAWRIPGMGEPGGLPSMGSHRVGHDWSDLAVAACIKHIEGENQTIHMTLNRWWWNKAIRSLSESNYSSWTPQVNAANALITKTPRNWENSDMRVSACRQELFNFPREYRILVECLTWTLRTLE